MMAVGSQLHMIINSFEAARSVNTSTLIGPFCFFKVNEGCSHDRGKQTNPQ